MQSNPDSGLNPGHQEDFDKAQNNAEKRSVIQAQIDNIQTSINLKEDTIRRFPQYEAKLRPEINALIEKIKRLEQELDKYQD